MYLHINFALSKRQLLSNAKILFNLNYRNYESIKINAGDKFAHVSVGNLQHFEGKQFVKEATAAGFVNLKGHRTVGGMRASIYNAMPMEGVEKLVAFMKKFEEAHQA